MPESKRADNRQVPHLMKTPFITSALRSADRISRDLAEGQELYIQGVLNDVWTRTRGDESVHVILDGHDDQQKDQPNCER